jgi:HPt (histidine-containing phosphotransfer) domain-containing protein
MDDYIPKPIRANTLIEKVAEWFKPAKIAIPAIAASVPQPMVAKTKTQKKPVTKPAEKETVATLPVINPEIVAQLKKIGGSELVQGVFEDFENETTELLAECTISAKNKDYNKILSNLHTIKGNAGTLGIEQMADQSKIAEQKLKNKLYTDLTEDLACLQQQFTEFKNNYTNYIT